MSQSELLKRVVGALLSAKARYMLTGSYASSLQGEPRLTHDIDLVVALGPQASDLLVAEFPAPDFYLDRLSIDDAIARQTHFNLIDVNSGDKVDFWILTDDPFDQSRFSRRQSELFQGVQVTVSTPEDTILMKLRWAKMSGGSEKQMGDVAGVWDLQGEALDREYLEKWAKALDVWDLLQGIFGHH